MRQLTLAHFEWRTAVVCMDIEKAFNKLFNEANLVFLLIALVCAGIVGYQIAEVALWFRLVVGAICFALSWMWSIGAYKLVLERYIPAGSGGSHLFMWLVLSVIGTAVVDFAAIKLLGS